jgi:hypothetical protein
VAWRETAVGDARASLWLNPSARIELPAPAARAVAALLREA